MRRLALMGVAALLVCAAVASSASALQAYNQSTGVALVPGAAVTGTSGTMTWSGTFFGSTATFTCTGSSFGGTLDNNGTVVSGTITSMTLSGCSTAFKSPCAVSAVGLPWGMGNGGGLEALSTGSVAVGLGSGALDFSDCMPFGATCTFTGATASAGSTPVSNAVLFNWSNATPQLSVSGTGKVKALSCTASNLQWTANYTLTSGGANVGLR